MEVSGQLHTATAFHPGKEQGVPTENDVGWVPEPVWTKKQR